MEERVDVGCPNLLIGGARLSSRQNLTRTLLQHLVFTFIQTFILMQHFSLKKTIHSQNAVNDDHVL